MAGMLSLADKGSRHEDAVLSERIRAIHIRPRGTYGLPRIHVELVATGICVGCKRIA
jgi:putative transposase